MARPKKEVIVAKRGSKCTVINSLVTADHGSLVSMEKQKQVAMNEHTQVLKIT